MEYFFSDKFFLEIERVFMVLGQESGISVVSDDREKLLVFGVDKFVSSVDGFVFEEFVQNENFQMEEDGFLKQSIFSFKLLDYFYCKSLLDVFLLCSEFKVEN